MWLFVIVIIVAAILISSNQANKAQNNRPLEFIDCELSKSMSDEEWRTERAEKGDINCQDWLAFTYIHGYKEGDSDYYSVEPNREKAYHWVNKIKSRAANGDRLAQAKIAADLTGMTYGDKELASTYRKKLIEESEEGHPEAQYAVARDLISTLNPEGRILFLRSAEQGFAEAYYWVAVSYEDGFGLEQDTDKAHQYYLRGANSYATTAHDCLCELALRCELQGDIDKAKELYIRAINSGSNRARNLLRFLSQRYSNQKV